jgi:hypothetical protein
MMIFALKVYNEGFFSAANFFDKDFITDNKIE